MPSLPRHDPTVTQQQRLVQYDVPRCVDIHCHCLPGLDDGPPTISEAIALCQAMADDGITTAIATPHQLGRYDRRNSASIVRQTVNEVSAELARRGIPLEIVPGADVRVDERILSLLDADEILTLADGLKYLLLELLPDISLDPRPLLDALMRRGIRPIISHPERHRYLQESPEILRSWLSHGASVQITAGSLIGEFGPAAQRVAWQLISNGSVSLIATDCHNVTHRPPCLSTAIDRIAERFSSPVACQLCIANPLRIFEGRRVHAVVPGGR